LSRRTSKSAVVSLVEPDSPAAEVGLLCGDRLSAIDGRKPRDIIDFQLMSAQESFELEYVRDGEVLRAVVEPDEFGRVGVSFESSVFDRLKTCRNRCVFCFVDQLPPGCRDSLLLKDDDYRLSFLYGNFVTLTNITDTELERVIEDRLSPLYVSLHTLDPVLRREMLRPPPDEDRTVERLSALCAAGIEIHIQIVACPGVNDGEELTRTLRGLRERFPAGASVGIVPVGLTGHRDGLAQLRPFRPAEALLLLEQVEEWQDRSRTERGDGWVYAADEFYLMTGRVLPAAGEYDDFPQLENGIGLTRRFLDEFFEELATADSSPRVEVVDVVTARLGAIVLRAAAGPLEAAGGPRMRVIEAANTWLGGDVSVAPLLAGADLLTAVREADAAGPILFPAHCLNGDGLFLDDLAPEDLERETGLVFIAVPPTGRGLLEGVLSGGVSDA